MNTETISYACGCSATGPAPLPQYCPEHDAKHKACPDPDDRCFHGDDTNCPNLNVESISFDELVQHGRDSGANIVNGMPWSFEYKGKAVTHENDQLYLIQGGIQIAPGQILISKQDGAMHVISPTFDIPDFLRR
jgi:hypothetical protein